MVSLLVRDYDEAIHFFIDRLGFVVIEDRELPEESKRWVVVAPPGPSPTRLLLARASTRRQRSCIGNQTGGRVGFFLHTDDFERDYAVFHSRGVEFIEAPRIEAYGMVAVFCDLYGNLWDLIEHR
jgi:catechol 2,3-dioxygenase-like lactoylglutathione lyase family enzyme